MLNALFDMSTDTDTGVLDIVLATALDVMPDTVPDIDVLDIDVLDIDVLDIDRAATSATPEPPRGASGRPASS